MGSDLLEVYLVLAALSMAKRGCSEASEELERDQAELRASLASGRGSSGAVLG